ncbi:MAG: PTS IIA-like nitrogen regulatory protein PtsN [Endozoicomonadaceae bacterium]|nr:PTS IIA-like nitrogen regulatory protein PtsN [Endozoicomonadaceae bacterium]
MSIRKILLPEHALCCVQDGSKKRTLEHIANLIEQHDSAIKAKDLLNFFIAREKLGSTGLGNGVAIPHCRLSFCKKPIAVLLQLAHPIDFDAIDRYSVDLVFALIVPDNSINEHLELLKTLAEKFSNPVLCEALRKAKSSETLYQLITSEESSFTQTIDETQCSDNQ